MESIKKEQGRKETYSPVNFFYDFHVARKQFPHYRLRPFLQRFREDSMVCVSNCPNTASHFNSEEYNNTPQT